MTESNELANLFVEAARLYKKVIDSLPVDHLIDSGNTYTVQQVPESPSQAKWVPQHICPGCGMAFKNGIQLYKHRFDNLWEDYHMRYAGKHRCTMCGKDFETKQDFDFHWKMERWHDDQALTIFHLGSRAKADNEGWEISPSEGALIERRIRTDENNRALKLGRSANRLVIETIRHHIKKHAMIVSECYGIPDSGKSWFVLSIVYTVIQPLARKKLVLNWLQDTENALASEIYIQEQQQLGRDIGKYQGTRELMDLLKKCPKCKRTNIRDAQVCPNCGNSELVSVWRDPQVIITFNMGQTVRAMRDALEYDTIVQDEDPDLVGAGRDTTIRRIENLLKTMRIKCINFMFVSPSRITYVENANLVFEVLYKRPPSWETKSAYFDREHVSLGWVVSRVLSDKDPRMVEYQKQKIANVEKLASNLGAEGYEYSFEDIKKDAESALKRLFKEMDKDRILGFAVQDFIEFMPALGIKDAGYYQSRVAKEMHFMASEIYSQLFLDDDSGVKGTEGDDGQDTGYEEKEEFPSTFSVNDEDYLKYVSPDTVDPKWLDGWKRYRTKESGFETYAQVACSVLGKDTASAGNCSDMFKKIGGAIAFIKGGMFELEMLRLYASSEKVEYMMPAPDYRYPEGLAPQGKPDRVIFLKDGSVRVCAWKVYDKNASFEIQRKGRPSPEIQVAKELIANGRQVKLVVEGLYQGDFFSKEIDPDTSDKVVTVYKRDLSQWPPSIDELLGDKQDVKQHRAKPKVRPKKKA